MMPTCAVRLRRRRALDPRVRQRQLVISPPAWQVDASGVYLVGFTFGTLPGKTSNNQNGTVRDAFVRTDTTSPATSSGPSSSALAADDIAYGVAVDPSGVYVAGSPYGTLPGPDQRPGTAMPSCASSTPPPATYSGPASSAPACRDFASGITANASGVYVAGTISSTILGRVKAFVRKVDAATGRGSPGPKSSTSA